MGSKSDGVAARHRPLLLGCLVVYAAALAVALLAPSSGTQASMATWLVDLGVRLGFSPLRATQARAEFLGNAAILAPLSALGWLLWPSSTWRDWTAYTFVLASAVEVTQGLLLADRDASAIDVVANTLGGLLGAVVAQLGMAGVRWLRPPRHTDPAVSQPAPGAGS